MRSEASVERRQRSYGTSQLVTEFGNLPKSPFHLEKRLLQVGQDPAARELLRAAEAKRESEGWQLTLETHEYRRPWRWDERRGWTCRDERSPAE